MKKGTLLILFVLLSLGATTYIGAQTTPKKKKKKKVENKINADSLAAARAADSLAAIAAAAPPPEVEEPDPFPDLVSFDTGFQDDFVLDTTKPIVDGHYRETNLRGAKPFAFPKENKNNIKFYKRIWREIDLTDSSNKIFAMPGETLIALILDAIKHKKLIAYTDQTFRKQMTYQKVMKSLSSDSSLVPILDSITGDNIGFRSVYNEFNPDSLLKYELKEDIYFDKTRGRVITQVVGISPVLKLKNSVGEYIGDTHPFWLYYPQCRNLFAAREVVDPQRDIYNESYDDMFVQRRYVARIIKESNPADLSIKDKYPGDFERQKKESERIEREIQNYKKNLWKY